MTLPARIGHYVPLTKLGEGGMGVVYCARDDRRPERLVALKVVSEGGAREDLGKRFQREARILESLRHPNIVTLYEVGVFGNVSYFAMELLHGTTLSPYCGKPYSETLPLLIQICAGMRYLAARRIVHRDLSPDNIYIVEEGSDKVAKILDFGVAKDTARDETLHNFTKTGLLMGKPMYWSPEQIGSLEPGEKLDWRSDVYALGVIFYRVLAGRLPFHADSPIGYIPLHLSEPPEELTAPPGAAPLPHSLVRVVEKMLAKDRNARPQSYKEIVDVFHELLGQELTDVEEWSQELPLVTDVVSGETDPRTPPTGYEEAPTVDLPSSERPTLVPTAATARLEGTKETVRYGQTSATAPWAPTAATEVLSPTAATAKMERETRRRHVRLFVSVGVAAAVLAGAGVVFVKTRAERERAKILAAPHGTLALQTMPWARVVSIRDEAAQKDVPVSSELTTPLLIELPPARYRVTLASGLGPETATLDVDVAAGRTSSKTVTLVPAERALALLD
jgi:serine/threonine-protein kinase